MNIFKAFAISFSLYSKIPMPQFKWEDKEMKYSLIFFPWVGLIIMGLDYVWYLASVRMEFSTIITALLLMAIPLIVTGGFHLDGYMDVEDSLNSYASPEKKLEIMKDPHIGAFAVIRLVTMGLIYFTALLIFLGGAGQKDILIYGLGFVISRTLSGISVLKFKPAKKEGMLKRESEVEGNGVFIALVISLVILFSVVSVLDILLGLCVCSLSIICFFLYRRKSLKEFGGVTGDTSGYFVVTCEKWIAIVLAVIICVRKYLLF